MPPDCPLELGEHMGADVLAKVERRWPKKRHELGPCLVWTGPRGPDAETGPYGRMYDPAIGKTDYVHRVVWRRCYGPILRGLDVDHTCNVGLCERPDHLQLLTKPATRAGGINGRLIDGCVRLFAVQWPYE
ncbi:MAG TPA: HNH endonuclease signature motif containing protein [Chloroflexota bacterium]|nr:HNH endonuclease signature motif containing protein [Chloroflexota bacterium]